PSARKPARREGSGSPGTPDTTARSAPATAKQSAAYTLPGVRSLRIVTRPVVLLTDTALASRFSGRGTGNVYRPRSAETSLGPWSSSRLHVIGRTKYFVG